MSESAHSEEEREHTQMADTMVGKGYCLGPIIGEGQYAKVRVCERSMDGEIMAVKIINLKKASTNYLTKFLPRELHIIPIVNHKHIIKTHEIIESGDLLYFIIDYAERGDLLCHIQENGPVPDTEAKRMFTQILNAVEYLHSYTNVAHRDLKCENILIMRDKSIVISDFGFARFMEQTDPSIRKGLSETFCGSASYASPEILRGIPYDPKLSDVWSLGVLLYIMVCGYMPFDDSNLTKMLKKQLTSQVPFPSDVETKVHPDCKSLIRQMLEPNVEQRITITELLKSTWICEEVTHS